MKNNQKETFEQCLESAMAGNAHAQHNLGCLY